jgi:hypothetical protein
LISKHSLLFVWLYFNKIADRAGCTGAYINILRHLLLIPASPCLLTSNMWKLIEMFVHQVVVLKDVARKVCTYYHFSPLRHQLIFMPFLKIFVILITLYVQDIANIGAADFKIAFDTRINSVKDEQKCQVCITSNKNFPSSSLPFFLLSCPSMFSSSQYYSL